MNFSSDQYIHVGDYEYRDKDYIGSGSYGKVYKGRNKDSKCQVAIKKLKMHLF